MRLVTVFLTLSASGLLACNEASSGQLDEAQLTPSRPSSAADLQPPALNFSKSDNTGAAELLSELSFGEVASGQSDLVQVIPIELQRGDQTSLSVWSDQLSAVMVYRPSATGDQWDAEELRLITEERKEGVEALTVSWQAVDAGRYAIALMPLNGRSQYLINADCAGGPCLDKRAQEEERSVSEELEATPRLER